MNTTNIHEVIHVYGVAVNCGVGHRYGSDSALLWPWHRPVAAAPVKPLAWELPCAAGAALKKKIQKNKNKNKKIDNPKSIDFYLG